MTRSIIELETTPEDHRVARLAAAAITLALVDSAIPLPLPGIKPGLANIVTMVVLARHGWSAAAWITGLRITASGLLLGNFLSPAFFLSFSGAVCSLCVLALVVRLPDHVFGPISWSLFAAFAHLAGQLLLARLWLIPHDGLFYLVPFFATAALIFGTINGLITARLLGETEILHKAETQNA
ncbi:MAG: Gx transporter family protein [Candidatus Accumulibacter sp.]|jgi:heptaprenyl diphosphate synthase|nr:Gx transporter family protein [Accumulibacter sp.]